MCSPTRASIMTGKYPVRVGVTNYLVGKYVPKEATILPASYTHHLALEERTIAEDPKEAGYVTGLVGKWHLGLKDSDSLFSPKAQGFNYVLGGRGNAVNYFYPAGQDITERITKGALSFIEENKDTPFFFIFCSLRCTHTVTSTTRCRC